MENVTRLSSSNWRSPVSGRLERVPEKPFPSPGYGMSPLKGAQKTAVEYFMSVTRTRDLVITGKLTSEPAVRLTDLKRVAYMFDCAQAAHRPGWFLLAQNLGYPSHLLARAVTEKMSAAQIAIENGDKTALKNALDFLHDEAVVEMLDNYIELAKGIRVQPEQGFAYLAWTADDRPELAVGASSSSMPEILAELGSGDRVGRERNWGVLGAWLVHDPELAATKIAQMFEGEGSRVAGSAVYVGERARAATKDIEAMLISTSNLVLSPWHVDDDLAFERLGIVVPGRKAVAAASKSMAM